MKGWFGGGKKDGAADGNAGGPDVAAVGAAINADTAALTTASAKAAGGAVTNTRNLNIQVTQQPGEDGAAFADRVASRIAEREQASLDNAFAAT